MPISAATGAPSCPLAVRPIPGGLPDGTFVVTSAGLEMAQPAHVHRVPLVLGQLSGKALRNPQQVVAIPCLELADHALENTRPPAMNPGRRGQTLRGQEYLHLAPAVLAAADHQPRGGEAVDQPHRSRLR